MGQDAAAEVAHLVADVIDAPASTRVGERVRAAAEALCREYPVYT
jgi:glycine/serine hydroxymethyltransferase